jgi:hypothetical protein
MQFVFGAKDVIHFIIKYKIYFYAQVLSRRRGKYFTRIYYAENVSPIYSRPFSKRKGKVNLLDHNVYLDYLLNVVIIIFEKRAIFLSSLVDFEDKGLKI